MPSTAMPSATLESMSVTPGSVGASSAALKAVRDGSRFNSVRVGHGEGVQALCRRPRAVEQFGTQAQSFVNGAGQQRVEDVVLGGEMVI